MNDTTTYHADWVVTTGPRRPLRRGLCPVGILAGMGGFAVTPQAEGESASHHLALALARRPFDEVVAAAVGARLVGLVDKAEKQQTMEMVAQLIAGVAGAQEAAEEDPGPIVCPGCYSVGEELCAPDCIDAELARKREEPDEYDGERNDEDE